jgi:L-histidine Nalpha-methyltransferase
MVMTYDLWEAPSPLAPADAFARDVRRGLSSTPKAISSAYFYDHRGSQLFGLITEQPEYYLTRCEAEILERYSGRIAAELQGRTCRLIEIGAGDGYKTQILLDSLLGRGLVREYVPIDICRQAVTGLTAKLQETVRGNLHLRGIVAEYFDAFPLLDQSASLRNLVLFLGSSIGNFGSREALRLLRQLRHSLQPGDFALIGFDLKKNPHVLQAAYDDAAGVTREFNFNLLDRMNRELAADFDRRHFQHHATYNLRLACMESWLISRRPQVISIGQLDAAFPLGAWEGIRVERSYKYDLDQIERFAAATGWEVRTHFFDRRRYFCDSLWLAV